MSNVSSQGNAGCNNSHHENSVPEDNNDIEHEGNTVDEGSDKLKEERQGVSVDMTKHLDDNQAEYSPAIKSFTRSHTNMSTDSHRISTLHTYGKYKAATAALTGVQRTSVVGRRLVLDGRRVAVGRPYFY